MPQRHAKTSLMSEVLTDHEVSDKLFQMYMIRKEDIYGIFVELSILHKPDPFFGVNLRGKCMVYV